MEKAEYQLNFWFIHKEEEILGYQRSVESKRWNSPNLMMIKRQSNLDIQVNSSQSSWWRGSLQSGSHTEHSTNDSFCPLRGFCELGNWWLCTKLIKKVPQSDLNLRTFFILSFHLSSQRRQNLFMPCVCKVI